MQQQNELLKAVIGLAVVLLIIAVLKFSNTFCVDAASSARIIAYLVIAAVLWGAVLKFSALSFNFVLPLIVLSIWIGFFPALDYWSATNFTCSSGFHSLFSPAPAALDKLWFDEWYTKSGVSVGILLIGYGRFFLND